MADRTVSVNLIVDAKRYVQGMDEAVRKTQDSTRTIEQQLAAQERAYTTVGIAATAVGVAALAGVSMAVSAYAEFDQAMAGVQASTRATTDEMDDLSDAALNAGQRTIYSATEAAAAIENLSRAGVSTADILNGALDGSLDLAASDGLAVADAAELAASAMTQFGLVGQDVSHVADLLAAGAGKAQGGVADLGAALNQSGLVAAQMGLSIDETVGSLTAFASAGLIGSDAGTSFRAMLLRLANPTQESARIMDDLGLSFYDAQGQFIGMEGVAGQLASQLRTLTDEQRNAALAQIFGQDAIRSASILYTQGAEGIREWTDAVDEQGYAAEQAAINANTLRGDLEQLDGAWETFMINLGAGADGPMRAAVQGLTGLIEGLGDMDPVMQAVILGALTLTGTVALAGGAAAVALPKIVELRAAMSTLGISTAGASAAASRFTGFLGNPWTLALAAAAAGVVLLNQYLESTRATTAEVEAMLRGGASAAQLFAEATPDNLSRFDFDSTSTAEFEDWINRIAARSEDMWQAFDTGNIALDNSGFSGALADVDERLGALDFEGASRGFQTLAEDMGLSESSAARLLDAMPDVRDALLAQAAALEIDVTAADGSIDNHALLAIAYGETGDAAGVAETGVEGVGNALETAAEQGQQMLDAQQAIVDLFFASQDAMSAYEQSIDDIAAALNDGEDSLIPALTEGAAGFDLTQQSGRDASGMLQELVSSAQSATEAMVANGDSAEAVAGYQATAREQIFQTAREMGLSEEAARAYADRLISIPSEVFTGVSIETAAAQAELETFLANNGRRVITIGAEIATVSGATTPGGVRYGYNGGYDAGGRIPGPYLGYDDRLGFDRHGNVFGLAGNEWIINAASSSRWDHVLRQINDGTFAGYASGGRVGIPTSTYSPSINVATSIGDVTAAMPKSFVRELGDYVAAQIQATGTAAFASSAGYADERIQGEAVMRR